MVGLSGRRKQFRSLAGDSSIAVSQETTVWQETEVLQSCRIHPFGSLAGYSSRAVW